MSPKTTTTKKKVQPQKPTTAAAKKSVATPKSASAPAVITSTKQEPVITKRTSGGPSNSPMSGVGAKAGQFGKGVKETVTRRRFWLWVGGVALGLLTILVLWWNWQQSWVAKVGSQYVTTNQLDAQNRASNGTKILAQLVQQQLIMQEAQRKNVTVTESQVNAELQKFKDSAGGQESYDATLSQYGITEDLLMNQIKVRLMLESLLKDKLVVTDKDIQDYYDQNKAQIDPDNKGLTSELKAQISDQIKQQKLSDESQTYVDSLQQRTPVESALDHATMSFGTFLQDEVLAAPQNTINFFAGKK